MTVEHATRSYLLTVVAVTALVSTRMYQLKLPQKSDLPAIRIQLIDEPQNYHLRGPDGATRARLQVDIYGSEAAGSDPYAAVTAIADVVDDAISGKVFESEGLRITGAFRNDRRVGYEAEELRLIRCMLDYTVWVKAI